MIDNVILFIVLDFLLMSEFNCELVVLKIRTLKIRSEGMEKSTMVKIFTAVASVFSGVLFFGEVDIAIQMFVWGVIIANAISMSIALFFKPDFRKVMLWVMSGNSGLIGLSVPWSIYILDDIFSWTKIIVLGIVALGFLLFSGFLFKVSLHV